MRFFQLIALEFIIMGCINIFVIAITPIATRFSKKIIVIYSTYCNENLVLHKPLPRNLLQRLASTCLSLQ